MVTESEARAMPNCPACDEPKTNGAMVCWTCFKREHGLKNSGLEFEDWMDREITSGRVIRKEA